MCSKIARESTWLNWKGMRAKTALLDYLSCTSYCINAACKTETVALCVTAVRNKLSATWPRTHNESIPPPTRHYTRCCMSQTNETRWHTLTFARSRPDWPRQRTSTFRTNCAGDG